MSSDFSQISKILSEYRDVVVEDMQEAVDETTKEAVDSLHTVSVPGSEVYGSWKAYKKGWTSKKVSWGTTSSSAYKKVVYNKDKYRLAHLLEYGTNEHAMTKGGRTHPGSDAFPHIEEIDENAAENLMKRLKEKL